MATIARPPAFRVLVSGASGMLGQALVAELDRPKIGNSFRPEVYTLVRHTPRSPREIFWHPYEMHIDVDRLEGFDAVVHLAGENIGSGNGGPLGFLGRWDTRKKHMIMESRRRGTRVLAQALASLRDPPPVMVSASGVGFYGDRGDTELSDDEPKGTGFLSDVAEEWEKACEPARAAGIRVVNLRLGVVLTNRGGVVEKLHTPFWLGLGGPVGSGSQYMSWITLGDAVRAVEFAIARSEVEGPVNTCAPEPCTSADFAAAFGAALSRPAIVPLPELVVRTVFGEMGEETLLASTRAVPRRLQASGFRFMHPDIRSAMRAALSFSGGMEPASHTS